MYDKLNKLEHFSKCLYKTINKFLFLFRKYKEGGENYPVRSSTSDKYKYFKGNQYVFYQIYSKTHKIASICFMFTHREHALKRAARYRILFYIT